MLTTERCRPCLPLQQYTNPAANAPGHDDAQEDAGPQAPQAPADVEGQVVAPHDADAPEADEIEDAELPLPAHAPAHKVRGLTLPQMRRARAAAAFQCSTQRLRQPQLEPADRINGSNPREKILRPQSCGLRAVCMLAACIHACCVWQTTCQIGDDDRTWVLVATSVAIKGK